MNLEVLFHSADLTGNATLREIAMSHADTTIKNHIRDDGTYLTSHDTHDFRNKVSLIIMIVQVPHGMSSNTIPPLEVL